MLFLRMGADVLKIERSETLSISETPLHQPGTRYLPAR